MTTLNEITGLVEGQYGEAIVLQVVDDDGAAINISSYTGTSIKALSPDHQTLLSFAGSFVTTGTDGRFQFTPTISNTFTRNGTWIGQVQFTGTNILTLTVPFTLEVEKKL